MYILRVCTTFFLGSYRHIQPSAKDPCSIWSDPSDIPYMQSIESLLEFEQPNSKEIKYYDIIRIRSRGKEVFIHQNKDPYL